ncbi:MAG: GSCFA domain-containing protein, partial [Bacteroidales bacterium]
CFDNQVSKSTLILASHNLVGAFREVDYFPSYEIFMDDLRDYRFYDADMIHPGPAGVEYVWHRFLEVTIDRKSRQVMLEIESVRKAVGHRSKGFMTPAHADFLKKNLEKVLDLAERYPFLDLTEEENYFRRLFSASEDQP